MDRKNIVRYLVEKYRSTPTALAKNLRWTTNHLYSVFRSKDPSPRHYPALRKGLRMDRETFWTEISNWYDPKD